MHVKIQKWGNSQGLRVPKSILNQTNLMLGDEVSLTVEDGAILISPIRKQRPKYDINDLVKRIPKDYKFEELDWGRPVGKEVW